MNPEGPGPNPDNDFQAPRTGDNPVEYNNEQGPDNIDNPNQTPAQARNQQRRRGLFGRIFHRRENQQNDNQEPQGGNQEENHPELQREKFYEQNRLADAMNEMTARDFRERKLNERYGVGRLAGINKFLTGERNFSIDENGQVQRHAWRELAQKAAVSVFNKRTVVAGVSLGVVGALTGGVTLPAASMLFGTMAGRGVVEAWHSMKGRDKGLREQIAVADYMQYRDLRRIADTICPEDPNLTAEQVTERNNHISELVNGFYQVNDQVEIRRAEMLQEQQMWNHRRRVGEFLGGAAGLSVGIWHGLAELSHKAMTMDIDGDGTAHLVQKSQEGLAYAYNNSAEAVNAVLNDRQIIGGIGEFGGHILGENTATVAGHAAMNMAPEATQVAAVMTGLYMGQLSERRADEHAQENLEQKQSDTARVLGEERDHILGQIPEGERVQPNQAEWQQRFETEGKPIPIQGEYWASKGAQRPFRIENIDYGTGRVNIIVLNPDLSPTQDEEGNPIPIQETNLDNLLRNGNRRQEFANNWLNQFGAGDHIRIDATSPLLVDENRRPIEAGDYTLVKDANNPNQVSLRRPGQPQVIASPSILSLFGFNRLEPAEGQRRQERQERVPLPEENDRYSIINRDLLPANLQSLHDMFVIARVDNRRGMIHVYDSGDRNNAESISFDDWNLIFRNLQPRGVVAPQQRQGGGPRQGGQQGGGGAQA